MRLVYIGLLFLGCNFFYSKYLWPVELKKEAPLMIKLTEEAKKSDVIYFGESSNFSFNPYTDTLSYSISEFLQLRFPEKRITHISHSAYHAGLFLSFIKQIPENSRVKTVVVTMNMRTFDEAALHSPLEPFLQKQRVYYSNRPPLMSRLFLTLKYYDNRDSMTHERDKFRAWRTNRIDKKGFQKEFKTLRQWMDAPKFGDNKWPPSPKRIITDHYVKAFAFLIDESNPRIAEYDEIVRVCKRKKLNLIFVLLPENVDYARALFGEDLLAYMFYNRNFLANRYGHMEAMVADAFESVRGVDFTEQFWTSEHYNQTGRMAVADKISGLLERCLHLQAVDIRNIKANYRPDKNSVHVKADTLVGLYKPEEKKEKVDIKNFPF